MPQPSTEREPPSGPARVASRSVRPTGTVIENPILPPQSFLSGTYNRFVASEKASNLALGLMVSFPKSPQCRCGTDGNRMPPSSRSQAGGSPLDQRRYCRARRWIMPIPEALAHEGVISHGQPAKTARKRACCLGSPAGIRTYAAQPGSGECDAASRQQLLQWRPSLVAIELVIEPRDYGLDLHIVIPDGYGGLK
jgi:hypothetical protein